MEIFVLKHLFIGKLGLFSGMYNDALMHREGLKGFTYNNYFSSLSKLIGTN